MPARPRYSQHALQRVDERSILRRWVAIVMLARPERAGRRNVFTLSADELAARCGGQFCDGLRVVVDAISRRIVTAHWLDRKS